MRVRRGLGVLAAVVGSLVWAAAVRAEQPCMADLQKFCGNVPVGEGKVQACLKAHEADLSPACRQRVDDFKQHAGALVAACRYDIMRFCSEVRPGGGRIVHCLQAKQGDLSPECKDRLTKAPAR